MREKFKDWLILAWPGLVTLAAAVLGLFLIGLLVNFLRGG